ncbi:MAG: EAL domain-containing protein [Rudaea sp.]|uniref:sensor domain-containing phosphodiesterase n=1 Tax=Rudaea sp. TaxID=2136325 RepID=UPI0039E51611
MDWRSGKWSAVAKALVTALALDLAARAVIVLATPANPYALLWPISGVALAFVYYWGWPALLGVALGSLAHNLLSDWQWFSLPQGGDAGESAFASAATLVTICFAGVIQSWLSAHVLRSRMPALREGSLSVSGWLWMFVLAGPVACLLRAAMLGLALGWIALPLHAESLAFASVMWVAGTLGIWMAMPLIVLRELRVDAAHLARERLRNPWIVLALVAIPAWALAAYIGAQQAAREQQRFAQLANAHRGEMQASLDLAGQKLSALRAYYRATGEVTPDRFVQFADELLERTPLLLGIGWAARIAERERAAAEATLAEQSLRPATLTELDAAGDFVPAARRAEYWPLLRIAPAERMPLLGLDLAAEPRGREALRAAQGSGLTASSGRAILAGSDGARVPALFLYLATLRPPGAVVAALEVQTLLCSQPMGQRLLAEGHGLALDDAGGEVVAQMEPQPGVLHDADPALAQRFDLRIGAEVWRLRVTTAKAALPYLSAPLWWFGQTLPQLLCALVGLFLALLASNERQVAELERHYSGYIEGHRREAARRTRAATAADAAIAAAWDARAFEPRFQPIVDVRSGEIRGIEALLRWHGAPADMATSDVIDWAERHGLIGELDHDMFAATLRAAADWPLARLPGFTISVNVSASDMQHPLWAEQMLGELASCGIAGRNLCVEITEGVLIRAESGLLAQLGALRAAGVRIALDDFGTGYSSIAYLRQLPVDRIKLDRVFVSDLPDDEKARRIVASILALGHTLDIDLVAEGVEDARTAQVLVALGCRLVQGRFYYADALDARSMRALLVRQAGTQPQRARA